MYKARRDAFMQAMGSGVAILPTAPTRHRTADQDYAFRPDSDFYYLTGFREPESVLVLAPEHPEHRVILFVRPRDPERETWDGRRAGLEGAMRDWGADVAYSIHDLDTVLPRYLEGVPTLHYRLGRFGSAWDARVIGWIAGFRTKARNGAMGPTEVKDPAEYLHERRLHKDPEERELMRRAGSIAAAAHVAAMKACRPGMAEYELQAEIEYVFKKRGSHGPSYGSIVGGGGNACILHYQENESVLKDGELVLIDAGCEVDYYASDITRTFPVNGRFTSAQRELYDLVLQAQKEAVAMVRPGVGFMALHERAVEILTAGMVRLGLLQGAVPELIQSEAYKRFYMHKTGHWLGLDVHDVGTYKRDGAWRALEPGMVLTVEPGIYVPAGSEGVDPRYWDIGVRIEDDVLVTADGHEVLTAEVPKEIAAIEALMARGTVGAAS